MALPTTGKRKTIKSSSLSPEFKRLKDVEEELSSHEESAIEAESVESVLPEMSAIDAEQGDQQKVEIILNKLENLQQMATDTAAHINLLRETVNTITSNLTVVGLQKEFSRVEKDLKSVVTETNELKASIISLNKRYRRRKGEF